MILKKQSVSPRLLVNNQYYGKPNKNERNGVLSHPEDSEYLTIILWDDTHCPPDTGFEIRALEVWCEARYLSVTEASHIIESLRMSREETFCFFETWRSEWGSNPWSPTFQAGSFKQGPRPCGKPFHHSQCSLYMSIVIKGKKTSF